MKKNKKNFKLKKQKKSISQKITGINTTSSISYGDAVLNPKDKKVKWIFVASITVFLAIGIGIPMGFAGFQYIAQKPYDINDKVIGDQTVGDFVDSLDKDSIKINKNAENIENIIVEKLYIEERNAFLKFEAFVNNTKYKGTDNKVGATSFGVDVSKSFDGIEKDQQKKLNVAKKAMRESDPLGWPEKWNSELKTNELYGVANTDKEAVDFMTKTIAKDAAFARFNTAEISTEQWTQADLHLQAKQNIMYQDNDGKEQIILVGTKLFSESLLLGKKNFLNINGDNVAIPSSRNPITPSSEIKIAVYQTKSYVLTERNPLNRLPGIYDDYFNSANISSIVLPITKNEDTAENSWTISRDLLFNLFKIITIPGGEQTISINKISKFQGANTESTAADQEIDKLIINTLTTTSPTPDETPTKVAASTGSMLGSSKATSLATLMKSEENTLRSFNMVAISSDITPSILNNKIFKAKQANPILTFFKGLINYDATNPNQIPRNILNLIIHLKTFISFTNPGDEEAAITPSTLSDVNKETKKLIDNISDHDFNNYFSNSLEDSFKDANPYFPDPTPSPVKSFKHWTAYQLSLNTYLYVGSTGLTIYNIQNMKGTIPTNMIKSDIQNTIDVINNPDKVVLYDVASQYNKIANENIINKILIEEQNKHISDTLIEQAKESNNTMTPEEAGKIINDVYVNLIGKINNTINPEFTSAMTAIPELIDGLIKPMNTYDFYLSQNPNVINEIEFMNGLTYTNGNLTGKRKIYSQFWNKLYILISPPVAFLKGVNNVNF